MTTRKILLTASALIAIGLSGCSSTPPAPEKAALDISRAQEQLEKERTADAQKKAEQTLDAFPSWALQVPQPDSTGVYALGLAESDKVATAMKMAQLQAEYGLAKLYNQELAGSEQSAEQSNGNTTNTQYNALITKLVDYVPVVGFQVIKQEVKAINGKFHAFILMKLPYQEFNRVLQEQRGKAQDAANRAAFDELERRLEERRKAKSQNPGPA